MATKNYDTIASLQTGKYDHKIKVRVSHLWRGATNSGEEFKSFNLILIDAQKNRIHAFAPTFCAEDLYSKFVVGKVCIIKTFTVQLYKTTDIFRCLRNDKQLVFTNDTSVEDIQGSANNIPQEMFDFLDYSELRSFSKQTTYLTDLVGIIKHYDSVREIKNRLGQNQKQAKFEITDGNSSIHVTFWDKFGLMFDKAMKEQSEKPVIIIIACARVRLWNDKVDISHVHETKVYLNHKHHSVAQLRRMLRNPEFANKCMAKSNSRDKTKRLLTIEAIKNLRKEEIQTEVMTHVNISSVEETPNWYYYACTECHRDTKFDTDIFLCENCNRIIDHPDMKFKINVVATDQTGRMQIILGDRQVRTIVEKRARNVYDETTLNSFPICLKDMANKDYTIMVEIREMNVVDHFPIYWATNIAKNFVTPIQDSAHYTSQMQASSSQATTTTMPGISDLNFQST